MTKTKKNDFIEIDYLGKIKDTNQIFDLTDEEIAKENKIHNPNAKYGPVIICIGQKDVIPGLDENLENQELNKKLTFNIEPEKGFGKKNPKLLKLMPAKIFKDKNIKPFPGLQVNFDGTIGTIRTISGGRIIVDFNHPLAGRNITYEITIKRIIKQAKEKLNSILQMFIKEPKFEIKEGKATIHDIPQPIRKLLEKRIKETIPEIKHIDFLPKQETSKKQVASNKPKKQNKKHSNSKTTTQE